MPCNASCTTLYRCPGALSLPSVDPHALAMETLLRMCDVQFTKVNAPASQLRVETRAAPESVSPPLHRTSPQVTCTTLDDLCVRLLPVEQYMIVSSAWDSQQMLTHTCVETLALHRIFPAFTFMIHYDAGVYKNVLAKTVVPRVCTLMERLTGSYRMHTLRRNCFFYRSLDHEPGGDTRHCATVPETQGVFGPATLSRLSCVVWDIHRSMTMLENLYAGHHSPTRTHTSPPPPQPHSSSPEAPVSSSCRDNSHGATDDFFFFLGTTRPTMADAYAYAAVSCVLHADFASCTVCPIVCAMQQRLRASCPGLVQYAERLRQLLYDDYRGSYHLRPVTESAGHTDDAPTSSGAGGKGDDERRAAADPYARGRRTTLLSTALFACGYALMANLGSICSALLLLLDKEETETVARVEGEERRDGTDSCRGRTNDA